MDRRARTIGRQCQGGDTCQLGLPIGQLVPQHGPTEPVALPTSKIYILDLERRVDLGRLAIAEGVIALDQLPPDHAVRPVIRNDVMRRKHHDVLFVAHLDH